MPLALSLLCLSLLAAPRPLQRLAPLAPEAAKSTHAPYEMGSCETCHQRADAKNPGKALVKNNDRCFACHEDYKGGKRVKLEEGKVHPAVKGECTRCHNPHNSKREKLQL